MSKLSEVYDVTRKHRSIDYELPRATLKQFFKTAPDYVVIPQGNSANLIVNDLDYIVTDGEGNLIEL